ncbi:MAG: undecaprenyldiphospho-muramoylpentapeptide beta-N-acetylglucosaminyltransferase [Candidatus Eremiobacteraeota bacterium]|nr:undecaprenyldiphospho-muramoylpentapeptide beta-N-acetylglucosaminyltransferase [Candidatus Eremiobacteraeota bacterium]
MKVIVTGGGTGGHLFPALAVAKALKKRHEGLSVLFLGTRHGLEATRVPQEGLPLEYILSRGLSSNPFKAGAALAITSLGFLQSIEVLLREKPRLVVGTGGYVSAPVVMAAHICRVPAVLLEQNTIPGKTNRFLARFARKVCTSFQGTERYLPPGKAHLTGNPVREEILEVSREEGRRRLEIPPGRPCILVTGASQGAKSINEGILKALEGWKGQEWSIIHLTGERNYEEVSSRAAELLRGAKLFYRAMGFLGAIHDAYAACDLVVCRAGATTIAEVTARGIPALIIPYPYAAEDHQVKNARWLEEQGAAFMIADDKVKEELSPLLGKLMRDPEALRSMAERSKALGKPEALDEILKVLDIFLSNQKA